MPACHQCAQEFRIDDNGIANHLTPENEIDYDADADHVPYELPVSEDHSYPTNWEPKAYGSED